MTASYCHDRLRLIIHTGSEPTIADGATTLARTLPAAPPAPDMAAEDFLLELRRSRTDLARLVEAVSRDRFTRLVISQRSAEAWERREPDTWAKVRAWLTARGVSILQT